MATFILFWNPSISSFKLSECREFLSVRPDYYDFNWSVWEHQKAAPGDRFYMIRCKNKPVPGQLNKWGKQLWEPCIDETTGICMAGKFKSNPWKGEDWSGKGRETFYVNLWIDHMADPDKCIIVPTAELMEAIPEFDWKGGHSGRVIDEPLAEKLEAIFAKAVEQKKDNIWSPEFKVLID